ncbi:hypothetical protein FQN54_002044 [Arachnomyces sp. PD_36]|nr:hypothetical protein FQN54_002044 [Arachnomyces sp. PD_36]
MSSSQQPASSLKDEELTGREDSLPETKNGEGHMLATELGDGVEATSEQDGVSPTIDPASKDEGDRDHTDARTTVADSSTGTGEATATEDKPLPDQIEGLSISSKRPDPIRTHSLEIPPPPPTKDELYLDPTPKTPLAPQSPSGPNSDYNEKELPEVPQKGGDLAELSEKAVPAENGGRASEDSQSEIQSIMEQFTDDTGAHAQEEIMSPRLEFAGHILGGPGQFPPRKSSLEPSIASEGGPPVLQSARQSIVGTEQGAPAVPPKSPPSGKQRAANNEGPISPSSSTAALRPPPPEPEPDQPFDFHRFLEQLRHRTADPVAKFLRSFLNEFGKKQWMVHEQVKIISDFLAFITNKMAQCEVWRNVSDVEFDNAKEGMEKLVMNRLYSQTFSPAIPPPSAAPARSRSRSKRREMERTQGPGRRGQHQEDVERDEVLAQKVRIYGWVREAHLDIPAVGPNGRRFLNLAQQGLLRNAKSGDTSADSFVPLLIYVVLQANPEHLVSNIQYILRFRNQDKLGGEAGYYLSSLSGAIQFIETLDRTTLTVSDEEFERNVEAAVSEIAERNKETESPSTLPPNVPEKSAPSGPKVTPRNSLEGEYYSRRRDAPQTSDSIEDNPAVAGLLRTIQKPLSTIGKIFSDETGSQERPVQGGASKPQPQQPAQTQPQPQTQTPRLSPAVFRTPQNSEESQTPPSRSENETPQQQSMRIDAQEAAARQATAEAAEARRIYRAEHKDVVETLSSMFPNLDKDVIDDVVRMKEGRIGLIVDACLALNSEQ